MTPRLLLTLALLALSACRPAPPAAQTPAAPVPPVQLRVLPQQATLRSAAALAPGLPWSLSCELASGPLRREGLGRGEPLAETLNLPAEGVFGCAAQVGAQRVEARPPAPGPPRPSPRPAPVLAAPRRTPPGLSPSPVAGGTLRLDPAEIHIGRREPWVLRADLQDAAGQPVPDGTLVTLLGRGPQGETLEAGRITVNGEATWLLQPEHAGSWTLRVSSGAWTGALSARARSALLRGVPGLLWTGGTLTLGPLVWTDGALPDDGTPVDVRALDASGGALWSAQARTVLGRVTLEVPEVPGAHSLRVQVAGSELSLPWSQP